MTIRLKVLLVVGLTMGVMTLMGLMLHVAVSSGRDSRDRFSIIQNQVDSFGRLHVASEQYLLALLRAHETGEDTEPLLRKLQDTIGQEQIVLKENKQRELAQDGRLEAPTEWDEALQALRDWAPRARQTVQMPTARLYTAEWKLLEDFERDVGHLLTEAQQQELREKGILMDKSEAELRQGARIAVLIPIASGGLLLTLILIVIVPLGGALRKLLVAARRVADGDLQVSLATERRDELGILSRAFDQMAVALKNMLEEKQRLMRAETEAKEQEARRNQALLEEKVRARTAELEQANAQLTHSLQQLKDTQAQLFFADRLASIGQLAAGVGHEINNPLSYVISNLHHLQKELVRHQTALPEDTRQELLEVVGETRTGAERVRLIVKDLKELARPMEEPTGPVVLRDVVSIAAKLVAREFYQRARLVEDCADVPPVRGSTTRLGQVFLNLFINAAHAIPKGKEEEHQVRVSAWVSAPSRVTVAVSDTGSGIAPENLNRIFDPFFTTKPAGEGTGLGLSVCRSIIDSLGGELQVSSEVGRGTTFSLILPIA